jgi:hypothetical protein
MLAGQRLSKEKKYKNKWRRNSNKESLKNPVLPGAATVFALIKTGK